MKTGPIALLAGSLAVALAIAGCGGDSSTSTSSVSKAEFVKEADAVCQGGNKRMEAGFAKFLTENKDVKRPTRDDYEKLVVTVLVPSIRKEIDELRALDTPSGDEDRADAIFDAVEEGLETAEGDPKLAVTSSDAVFGISSRLAKEYGLEVCGSR